MTTDDELDDSIIEDTTYCDVCGRRLICGDTDCLIAADGWCVCIECAAKVAKLYQETVKP